MGGVFSYSEGESNLLRCKTTFLSHIISIEGVVTDLVKLAAVKEWPTPANVSKKGQTFIWDAPVEHAFAQLKAWSATAGISRHYEDFYPGH